MTVFRDFKEETERLSDWLQQADINIKASKTSLLSTIEEKEKGVRDMNELNKRLIGGKTSTKFVHRCVSLSKVKIC